MTRAKQIDFKQAVHNAFGQVKGFTLAMRIAKYFYEKAEKDTINRAIAWLEEYADSYNGSESAFDHMEEEMITDFRKSMEEE